MTPAIDIQAAVIFFPDEADPGFIAPFRAIAGLPLLLRQLLWLEQHRIGTVYLLSASRLHASIHSHVHQWRKRRSLPKVRLHAGEVPASSAMPAMAILLDSRFLHHPDLLAHALSAAEPFAYVDDRGCLCGLGIGSLQSGIRADTLPSLPGVRLPERYFAQRVTSPAEERQAESRLLKSFIKTTDGWFSRHLNRPVSLRITRRIAHLPLHPNAITLFTLLIGIGAGWSAAQGSLAHLAAGGVLFQIASILDGVDGEVARAKLLHSKVGEWMDTVCDDLTNAVFIAGVSLGMYRMTPDLFWLTLGIASLVVYGATLLIMYGNLIGEKRKPSLLAFQEEIRRPDYRPGRMKAWLVSLQPFIKRDFYGYAFMLCGLLGIPKILIGGWSIGAFLTLGFISSEWKIPSLGNAFEKILRKGRRS
jgi:phosphatidylglycerophosphate synthase